MEQFKKDLIVFMQDNPDIFEVVGDRVWNTLGFENPNTPYIVF